jgi:CubicO group peptidase (beta-lactamase class C family)
MTSKTFDRRTLFALSAATAAVGAAASACASPTNAGPTKASTWATGSLKDAGFAKLDVAERIDAAVASGQLTNIHSVVAVRHNKLLFERYYEGNDEFWAMPLGPVKFGPTVKHDMRSATKSIIGLLYGIALYEGKVPGLDAVLIDQFPEYPDLAKDPMRRRMKIRHVLSMTAGFYWPEDIPYTKAENPELGMYLATDQFRYLLDRPMESEPGEKWNYSGGCTALLGHLIAKGTGKPLFEYAREKLFAPLGIVEVQWVGGTNGEVSAPSGLRMPPRELAKIGQMVLNKGRWGDKQVVPAEWLTQTYTPYAKIAERKDVEYGYHWYLIDRLGKHPAVAARGNGGQFLYVVPTLDLVIVVMAGNYNAKGGADSSMSVVKDFVLDALGDA